jgi:hypothetical protein
MVVTAGNEARVAAMLRGERHVDDDDDDDDDEIIADESDEDTAGPADLQCTLSPSIFIIGVTIENENEWEVDKLVGKSVKVYIDHGRVCRVCIL